MFIYNSALLSSCYCPLLQNNPSADQPGSVRGAGNNPGAPGAAAAPSPAASSPARSSRAPGRDGGSANPTKARLQLRALAWEENLREEPCQPPTAATAAAFSSGSALQRHVRERGWQAGRARFCGTEPCGLAEGLRQVLRLPEREVRGAGEKTCGRERGQGRRLPAPRRVEAGILLSFPSPPSRCMQITAPCKLLDNKGLFSLQRLVCPWAV